ncbi:MAG: helix-turn-helix domain-containing protein [Thermodesulfobacteriota bacterium]
MSLKDAIKQIIENKNLTPAIITARIKGKRSAATFYRILNGSIQNPRLNTFLDLCEATGVSPMEILQLASLWPFRLRSTDAIDLKLRKVFTEVQELPKEHKKIAVEQITKIIDTWRELNPSEKLVK